MKLKLLAHTLRPVEAICTAIAIMKEKEPWEFVRNLNQKEKETMIQEILKSRLRGALEFASFEFLLEDVTRAFTHQLVRHRAFHFSQQSMRFFDASMSGFRMPKSMTESGADVYGHVERVFDFYKELIGRGIPTEDARSILPTNVETKIMFGATMRGLIELAEVRMCWQAQGEFRQAMDGIREGVTQANPFLGSLLVSACARSGHCEFKSVYDRSCPIETERRRA